MKQVLFIHGGGGGAFEADAALAASLRDKLGASWVVSYPQMPDEGEPDYAVWRRIIREQVERMGEGAVLVGHSIGGSVIARVMTADDPPPVAGVFMACAPFWHDDEFWRWEKAALPADAAERYPADVPLYLYHSEDDEFVPFAHLEMYAKALPRAVVRRLKGRNHQLNEDMGEVAEDIRRLAD
jgi:predicted alpha/beta hydrolase family esterase